LAKRAEIGKTITSGTEEKRDDVNWFGTKIGSENPALNFGGTSDVGVGKYLSLKRPQAALTSTGGDESKKKRKIGFGDFEGW